MEVLKNSTRLVGLNIKECDNWNKIIKKVLDFNIASLKSLEVTIDEGYFCDHDHCNEYHKTYFPIEVIQALVESKIKLHTLKIKGFSVEPTDVIEVSKMESLKTLSILETKQKFVNHKVIEALAMNTNQLESIEIFDRQKTKHNQDDRDYNFDDYCSGFSNDNLEENYKTALNKLFERKQSTLKSIKMFNLGNSYCSMPGTPCVPLTNLSFCQNLEEFCGNLHSHDLKTLATLPKLKKLKLFRLDRLNDLEYLLSNMNLSKLKYLSLYKLGKCLKHLCHFIIFDKFSRKNENKTQKSFEDYLMKQDLQEFRRYKRMKENFKKWCENNPGYGY